MILTDISLKRPVFATVTILALIVLGLFGYATLNIDDWPNVELPYVTVEVSYKGASPEQVESKITQKVEEAVSSIAGIKHIYSYAKEGVSTTVVEFTMETPATVAAQDVRDKIGKIRGDLPQDADEPVIMRYDPTEAPVASIVVTGNLSVREMTTLVDDVIKRQLETVNGVGTITEQGVQKREIQISLDRDKLAAYGLTIPEIVDNLSGENIETPGGNLINGKQEVSLRTAGNFTTAADFLNAPVGRRDGIQLYTYNVATVSDGTQDPESITKFNGVPAVGLDIIKQSGTNTVQVVNNIKNALTAIRKNLPPGVELTLVRDNSSEIRESVHDVLFNLILGALLAVAIVFLFLGNWRSTLISAIAIPASVISTFFMMKLLSFTINNMSLMALSLAVGLLIDDAIVIIENIVRHMEMGKNKFQAASEATNEIGLAVTATTLTLVAVFVPVGMMSGIVGQFFRQFGITVAFAVLVSLFIAFTLTPMLSANFLDTAQNNNNSRLDRFINWWNNCFEKATESYGRFLTKALRRRGLVIATAVVLFVGSLTLVPFLGTSFISRTDNGQFSVWADIDSGYSVEGAAAVADRITAVIRAMPEVMLTYSVATNDKITVFVKLTEKRDRKRSLDEIITEARTKLNKFPGIEVSLVQKAGLDEQKPVDLIIRGESLDQLSAIADKAKRIMETIPGGVDVSSSNKPGKPDAQLVIKRELVADSGVSTATIADTMRTMVTGLTVSQFKDGDDRYDVKVRLAPENRREMADLNGIFLPSQYKDISGNDVMIPLSQVTDLVYATGPSEINRLDREKDIELTANLAGVSLGDYNAALSKELAKIDLPAGYSFNSLGESEDMAETGYGMIFALFLGISFIFFILAAQFESYIDPLSIMISLPLAIIGAIIGLLVMHSELSIMSQIGIIMLMGLVTKNAILLIDFAKRRRAEGVKRNSALVEAARIRMRPIMMTTAAMIFGMLPLAFGFGPGAESRAPMAHAIIGGLFTSTILTLIVVPVVYSLLDDLKHKIKTIRSKPSSEGKYHGANFDR